MESDWKVRLREALQRYDFYSRVGRGQNDVDVNRLLNELNPMIFPSNNPSKKVAQSEIDKKFQELMDKLSERVDDL